LTPRVHGIYSDDIAADSVLGIEPSSGTRITRSSTVEIRVSLGRPTIPDVTDDSSMDAVLAALRERTLTPTRGTARYSTDVPRGKVLELSPPTGTEVPVGSTVTVTASKGPPPVDVPDVAGSSAQEATKALTAAHLKVDGQKTVFDP